MGDEKTVDILNKISIEEFVAQGCSDLLGALLERDIEVEDAMEIVKACAPLRYGFFLGQAEREAVMKAAMKERVASRIMVPRKHGV